MQSLVWEAPQLSERQIQYAGNDAIVTDLVFFKFPVSKQKGRESPVEAGKTNQNEDIHVQAVDVNLTFSNSKSSDERCDHECTVPAQHRENIVPSQTDLSKTVVLSSNNFCNQG